MESEEDEFLSMEEEEDDDDAPQRQRSRKNKLECDLSAYVLFQEGSTGAPCLSFDVVRDNLGENRTCDTPLTCYIVTGSQASRVHLNNIQVLKVSNMHKVTKEEDEDSSSEEEGERERRQSLHNPVISTASAAHKGCVNRIRTTAFNDTIIAAAWSELGWVSIWDLGPFIGAVDDARAKRDFQAAPPSPLFADSNNGVEGFALDWSPTMPGVLATGDCNKLIAVWEPQEGGRWAVGSEPYSAHEKSVEDIQWSPNEKHVFASCSVDKSVRIWDTRAAPGKACMLTVEDAHGSDVNVIHWNRLEPFIASGGDDSKVLIWDLRKFQTKTPVATLQYHGGPVCSVEWHPEDSSVLATGGEDDCILQWDLAVERDEEAAKKKKKDKEDKSIPQQLLFVHQGQEEVKEIHWHPQIPGLMISTALSGFNVFKTISC